MLYTRDSSKMKYVVHADHVVTYLESTPEAMTLLDQSGFSANRLPEGQGLIQQVQSAFEELDSFLMQQKAATEIFNAEWKKLAALHRVHLQAARGALRAELGHLVQTRPQGYAGWSAIVSRFYAALLNNPEYQAKLNQMSIASEELVRANQWLESLIANKNQQNQSYHNHRAIQQSFEEKFLALKRWFDGLMALARVAFRHDPVLRQMVRPLPTRLSKEARAKLKAQKEEKKAAKSKKGAASASDANANGTPNPTEPPAATADEAQPTAVAVA